MPETVGGRPSTVRSAVLACARHRTGHGLDVVVGRQRPNQADVALAIGEAKCTARPVSQAGLDRLEHLRDLIPADRVDAPPRLLLFSRAGFTAGLRHAASARRDVHLVDLERLYRGE